MDNHTTMKDLLPKGSYPRTMSVEGSVVYSYSTPIAVLVQSPRGPLLVVSENHWSRTTGRHIARIKNSAFRNTLTTSSEICPNTAKLLHRTIVEYLRASLRAIGHSMLAEDRKYLTAQITKAHKAILLIATRKKYSKIFELLNKADNALGENSNTARDKLTKKIKATFVDKHTKQVARFIKELNKELKEAKYKG